MVLNPTYLAIAAISAIAFMTQPAYGKSSPITLFKPPTLVPFAHFTINVQPSTYVTATNGVVVTQANNQEGNFTGAITGKVLKLGAEFEQYPTVANSTESFYANTWTLNTTDGVPILMNCNANIHYDFPNKTLHGFARMTFSTDSVKYRYLTYGDYVAEFAAGLAAGFVKVDLFELESSGLY